MCCVSAFNSACLSIVMLAIACGGPPIAGGSEPPAPEDKQASPPGVQEGESKGGDSMPEKNGGGEEIVAVFQGSRYLADCKMLFVRVLFMNQSSRPLFVVANEFAYVDFGPGRTSHSLVAHCEDKELTLDVSHLMPTPSGIDYFVSEEGSFGPEDDCMKVLPGSIWNATYVFHFPLTLDRRVSESYRCEAPQGLTKVRLRFGYSNEDFETFVQREIHGARSAEDWQQRIVDEWQSIVEMKPFEIDFSQGSDSSATKEREGSDIDKPGKLH